MQTHEYPPNAPRCIGDTTTPDAALLAELHEARVATRRATRTVAAAVARLELLTGGAR